MERYDWIVPLPRNYSHVNSCTTASEVNVNEFQSYNIHQMNQKDHGK